MTELVVRGEEFVVIPKAEYLRLKRAAGDPMEDDAFEFMNRTIGNTLKEARLHAGFTQVELAKKLKKSQALISSAESGSTEVGLRYVKAVLKACGLPEDWKPKK